MVIDREKLAKYTRYRGWDDYGEHRMPLRVPSETGHVNLSKGFIDFFKAEYFIDKSFSQLLYEMCDSNISINDDHIANLILKYIHVYLHPEDVDKQVGLDEIHKTINIFIARNTHLIRTQYPEETSFFNEVEIQIRMILDISKTIEVVKEILRIPIDNQSVHLDLGTGSGLLALTQYILLIRSGCSDFVVRAIDNNPTAIDRLIEVLTKLEITSIAVTSTDLEEDYVYDDLINIPISDVIITQIPAPRQRLNVEMLIPIINSIFSKWTIDQLNNTHFIFNQIETYSFETDTTYLLNKENRYGYDFDETTRNDLANSYPRKIELNGEMVYLLDIGLENDKYLTDDGLLNMTPRW